MNYYQLADKVSRAGQQHDWHLVIELCERIEKEYPDMYDSWQNYWYARALFNTGNIYKSLKIAYRTFSFNPLFEFNNNFLKSALRRFLDSFVPHQVDSELIDLVIDIAWRLDEKNFFPNFLIKLAKKYKQHGDSFTALQLLEQLDINKLSTQKRQTQKGLILSVAESYAIAKAGLYINLNMPQLAIETVDNVLSIVKHPDKNALKFLREYKAKALINLNKFDEAINMLGPLLADNNWFWQFSIAQVLRKMGKDDQAFFFALFAAVNEKQKPWFKNKVYLFIIDNFPEYMTNEQAELFARFVVRMYIDNGYPDSKVPVVLRQRFSIESDTLAPYKELFSKATVTAFNLLCRRRERGKITKLRAGYGFVRSRKGETYYFSLRNSQAQHLCLDDEVEFCIGWNYDQKRAVMREAAYFVKLIEKKGK